MGTELHADGGRGWGMHINNTVRRVVLSVREEPTQSELLCFPHVKADPRSHQKGSRANEPWNIDEPVDLGTAKAPARE